MSEAENQTVIGGREEVSAILRQTDGRLLVVAGPCSIHDTKGALEYAHQLAALRRELAGEFCIVMRVYFEKPRTTVGWKGMIYDPHLDGSDDIQTGLKKARALLLEITSMGLPTAPPPPVTTLTTPAGMPALSSACTRRSALSGASDAGLMTTVLPATSAGAIFHAGIAMGKFQGVMSATTPSGLRIV